MIILLQICFVAKMAHDTYLNGHQVTRYTSQSKKSTVVNEKYVLKHEQGIETVLIFKNGNGSLYENREEDRRLDELHRDNSVKKNLTFGMVTKLIEQEKILDSIRLSEFNH
ncbi:hypothetical protein [Pediococcus stilesii]|nr:hypothetical protein [Pediococcus stilesii]TLQ05172.1 hypothetical protein FEZ51_02735 [Pediococcus stilesii]